MYFLEYKEPYIAQEELTKNRTHQSYRWKSLAVSKDEDALKEYQKRLSFETRIVSNCACDT